MMAVILPGVWSNAGMGSLIYLAALKNVDEDSYEAAEIDGCTFWEKLVYITIPYLKPLIIINFIGAFIGTFHAMGNIFAMTGGGPGDETTVLSLAIWYEAFAFMNFGTATAMAWFLGLMLIGFTVYQLRILNKVDFRRAEGM
jgi:ABC-type sugar transport system permease subunit